MGKEHVDYPSIVNAHNLQIPGACGFPPSRIFSHRDIFQSPREVPVIKAKKLINILNYLHFSNSSLLALLKDRKYEESFLMPCTFESYSSEEMRCRWPQEAIPVSADFQLQDLIVEDGLSLIRFPINILDYNAEGFSASIPDKAFLLGKRSARRRTCKGIHVVLTQSGFTARGDLIDFSPLAFRVRLVPDTNSTFIWMNADALCSVQLNRNGRSLFSGTCRFARRSGGQFNMEFVLIPMADNIHRFQKKKFRAPRLRVMPAFSAHFDHPFFLEPFQRDIHNLTFSGFSVRETENEGVLMPGMIIPNLVIRDSGTLAMNCDTQVIYRRKSGRGEVSCGLAILDMDFRSYRRLSHIMVNAGDPRACFLSELQMNELWKFFFDTGFIYPQKYQQLQSSRHEFKNTYRKLYKEDQEIAAHFTFRQNGRIYGHASMFRAYQKAWMVHHLAARSLNGRRTGLSLLKNILRFFDGLYRYPSIRMSHMLFYFRPENHFPNLFFGGFARAYQNPRGCSLDLFAYHNYPAGSFRTSLPEGWLFAEFEGRHFPELERFYRNTSGGLLLDALRLNETKDDEDPLSAIYERQGFVRRWKTFALTYRNKLQAVLIVNHSDIALNLSDLLNGVKIIVTDPACLDWTVLTAALNRLTPAYGMEKVPLLIYPADFPTDQGITVDKQYMLWILDVQHGRQYLDYMEQKTRLTPKFIVKHLLKTLFSKLTK
jgi:hypothetical protein